MNFTALPDAQHSIEIFRTLLSHGQAGSPRHVDKPLILYGAGKLGQMAAELFAKLDIPVRCAIDRHPPASGLLNGSIPVLTPDDIPATDRRNVMIAICIVTAPYEPIRNFLAESGWSDIVPVYDVFEAYTARLPMANGWFAEAPEEAECTAIEKVLATWSDDESRAAHLQFMAWRLGRQEWGFPDAPVSLDDRYFIPQICCALRDNEYFLDAGAYHGEVSQRVIDLLADRCQGILAIEPDHENFRQLDSWYRAQPGFWQERITVLEKALGATGDDRPFRDGLGMASRSSGASGSHVDAIRLDDLEFPVTFAKIHVEGDELEALKGATTTLQHRRPLLSITVYHNADGLWRTPAYLMQALPNYNWRMRLHAWCGTGAVVYGIPAERNDH
ncbi:FkbM family methyltransferase [Dechloromonas hortensis]|uniref:FkbM family methyltransferase n=1 Tax=Dechloromonas hortensis TaxID=337779 RepID=UPI001292B926|nr:FkbM family methyltransferase [Dechloromonas hortensis]